MPAPQTQEVADQDKTVLRNGEKKVRARRRKRKPEEGSSVVAAQLTLSNGVESIVKDKEPVRSSETGAIMQRKRKRGTGRRGSGQTSMLDVKGVNGLSGSDIVSKASSPTLLWKISEAIGGRLIHADPVFSTDERYLFLALPSALRIYSSATSLLARSLSLETSSSRGAMITAFILSPTSHNYVYVSTSRGRLEIWDWTEGKKLQRWEFESDINALAVASPSPAEDKTDVIFLVEKKYEKWRIKLFELTRDAKQSKTGNQTKVLYECQQQISNLKVLHEGQVVVATSGKCLVVGTAIGDATTGSYVWTEFTSPDWLTCLDARESSKEPISSKSKEDLKVRGNRKTNPAIDLVVGDIKGAIFVHHDILNRLVADHRKGASVRPEHLARGASRRWHWHREAVHSIKWSLDGNYILSGGSETVLVLWQLDTDKQQYLPHLSATVESIVVSPKGSSYAVKLADNSVMILSTTELKPKASIAGIQAKSWEPQRIPPEAQVKTVDSREAHEVGKSFEVPRVPSVINPLNPTQILLAVLSSQSSSFSTAPSLGSPYLQTFDFAAAHHISRQALARTNVSSLNVGPESNKIGEPNIELMSISTDGKWLATVDEWNPPKRDLEFLCLDEDLVREQNRRREVYLKFWSWNEENKMWELVTRVDAPHFSLMHDGFVGAGRITDMTAKPRGLGFATIGIDGSVKLWRPRKRTRDGIVLKGRNSKVLVSWGCYQVVQIGSQGRTADFFGDSLILKDEYPAPSCLAYSADGSVIVASYPGIPGQGYSAVHLIDAASGEIRYVRDGLQTGGIVAIGIVGPYAILLGEALIVWDMVQDTLQYGVKLRLSGLSLKQKTSMVRLAVNQSSSTFAIAVPVVKSEERGKRKQRFLEKAHSQVVVFDPVVPKPLFSVSIPSLVTALLPAVGSEGYVVLDLAAELRLVSATGSNSAYDSAIICQEAPLDEPGMASIEDASGGHEDNNGISDDERLLRSWLPLQPAAAAYDDDDSPLVVRQEQLAEIFDVGPSLAPPPVNELFEKVVGLFARKPVLKDLPSA
ncbi:hypothetical protein GP486_003613 [Trichoglossum hirsutum]|uniref:Uncharacterized protein n=1 Tax=Trichoglossum hirsutum TaxID=265104 RepID=A0A9P8LCJ4_9PEZI|nr:hypothetical protein GP486_003613 [Trichoglossum hirsutum]